MCPDTCNQRFDKRGPDIRGYTVSNMCMCTNVYVSSSCCYVIVHKQPFPNCCLLFTLL